VHRSTGFQLWRPTERTVREEDQPLLQECIKHYDRLREYSIEV
jgi:hypothetical protein